MENALRPEDTRRQTANREPSVCEDLFQPTLSFRERVSSDWLEGGREGKAENQ